jgi:hypothetical protein
MNTTQGSSSLRSFVAAGAIAFGVLSAVMAPAAQAQPISETTIKSECKQAGGTYSTANAGADMRWSGCTYKAADGTTYTDNYANGNYTGTHQVGPRPA